mgnify:CR=1 FL=1
METTTLPKIKNEWESFMIPGKYNYKRPDTKAEALYMLAESGDEARPLAGGHSLIPMMKLRMASPSVLVDIAKLDELRGISINKDDITIGAATTQHELINNDELYTVCPIIRETSLLIADPQIRYCGTIGGNVGNGDPGNDLPGLMQCLDATYVLENSSGRREVKARDYYQAAYFTALEVGEMITAIEFKAPAEGVGYAYTKLKRKVGDYATAAAAVLLGIQNGEVKYASIAMTNVADTPLYIEDAANKIVGTSLSDDDIASCVAAAEAKTAPVSDARGSAEYRSKMAGVMLEKALRLAKERAGEMKSEGGLFGWLKR